MSCRSSLCRILLRHGSLRSHSIGESPLASAAAKSASHASAAFSGGQHASWIDRQTHSYSLHGNQAALTNGLLSLQETHKSRYHPSYASGTRVMHGIAFSNYQHSGRTQGINSLGFQRGGGSRPYSGVPEFSISVLWTLIGANVAVFIMWHKLDYRFMRKHFTVSINSVMSGRLYTILTSAFSQNEMGHLVANLIGLYFFGGTIARNFGDKYLLALYLGGAICGSLGHLFYYAYAHPWLQGIPRQLYAKRYSPSAMGASGAVTTVLLLHIFLYPKQMVYLYFVVPMPAAMVGAIIIGSDLWLAYRGSSRLSVGGHLGGAVMACLAFLAQKV